MKDELQSKLVEILGSIQTAAGKAGDFAMVQLPDIAQSYVVYGRAVALMLVMFWVVVFIGSLIAYRWFLRNPTYSTYSWDEGKKVRSKGSYMLLIAAAICAAVGFAGIAIEATAGALVWFAPKVWLLKEIAGLIK